MAETTLADCPDDSGSIDFCAHFVMTVLGAQPFCDLSGGAINWL
jgi:hypothetical protein